jgi:N-alpha-acetyltransferase 50
VVIPVVYSDKFYKDALDPSLEEINKLSMCLYIPIEWIVYYADIPVGAIISRINTSTLEILTLA